MTAAGGVEPKPQIAVRPRLAVGQLTLLGAAHLCVDSYASLLTPLLPLLVDRLQLSLAAAGLLASVVSAANLTQPLMGLLGDRLRRRLQVPAGALLAALTVPMIGLAGSYAALVILLALGGLGVAAFHPPAFALVGELSGSRRAFGIAWFAFSGSIALGITPIWAPALVSSSGFSLLPLMAAAGVVTALLVWNRVPLAISAPARSWRTTFASIARLSRPLAPILAIVALRSVVAVGFGVFIPLLSRERGMSLVMGGVLIAIYNTAGVLASLLAGYLGDRGYSRPLVWASLLLAAPCLWLVTRSTGAWSMLWLALGGATVLASNSVLVAVAQQAAPGNEGLASSIPLGLGWGLGGLLLPLVGVLGDKYGLEVTLSWLALVPILPAALGFYLLPRVRR
jgi:FSR family fosmidomycin resistance protein-like MFS transporter